jgi:hypothetical protein
MHALRSNTPDQDAFTQKFADRWETKQDDFKQRIEEKTRRRAAIAGRLEEESDSFKLALSCFFKKMEESGGDDVEE